MFKNSLLLVIFLLQAFILTTSLSCTKTEELNDSPIDTIEQSLTNKDAELNKLKEEVSNQRTEITSKSLQVSALEQSARNLSDQLSEKADRLYTLESKLNTSEAKLIEAERQLYQVEYPIAIMSSDDEIVTFESPYLKPPCLDATRLSLISATLVISSFNFLMSQPLISSSV